MPADYVVAWFKYFLKQKKTEFSCPGFNAVQRKTCGEKLSYQDICRLIPLTDKQREFLEENLAALVAKRLFDFKACPGCQSHVERRDRSNLCVNCTICTANLKRTYYFCWNCRREWKGPANNAVRCDNNGCGQKARTSDPLKPCKPEIKKEILRKAEDIYPMKDKSPDRKRLALLINNVEFKHINDRTGADKDELSMEILLKGLGYTVVTLRDLTAQGMRAALQDFARREEHVQSDSCFVVLMSHGDASGISGVFDSFSSDDEEDILPRDEIFNSLNTPNCAGLRDKPKIILIQACRGDKDGSVDVPDSVPRNRRRKEHREKDFCCLMSSTPGPIGKTDTPTQRLEQAKEREIEENIKFFKDIFEKNNAELLELTEEKHKETERRGEELIRELDEEIKELKRRQTELDQLSNSMDFTQIINLLQNAINTKRSNNIKISISAHEHGRILRKTISRLQSVLDEKMRETVGRELRSIQRYAVDVTLDPDTAHPELMLSDNGKEVWNTGKSRKIPDTLERFNHCSCVLGTKGFSSQTFYYEVQVSGKTEWDLGVAKESIDRKGEIGLNPENGYWTLWLRNRDEYAANDLPAVPLTLKEKPVKVGVFVDFQEGLVSFYDVEARYHIYSFTGQTFPKKLYPYFSPGEYEEGQNSPPLIITPVDSIE
ncbi:unnamed protein product [Leuciscus chuanchicus]